ncbi:hypothetical protein GCM10025762_61160 [Haloechinothrix salitolerans]
MLPVLTNGGAQVGQLRPVTGQPDGAFGHLGEQVQRVEVVPEVGKHRGAVAEDGVPGQHVRGGAVADSQAHRVGGVAGGVQDVEPQAGRVDDVAVANRVTATAQLGLSGPHRRADALSETGSAIGVVRVMVGE